MKTTQTSPKMSWRQAASLFFLPTIGLYLVTYRLLGKRCTYHLGNFDVTPLEPITANEYLFTRLFPAFIALVGIGFIVGIAYLMGMPLK
ncbi:MAG: hypothetical protein HYR94_16735 [Chloroflexi bacterium]|nr:hypothetical protein [Chloroflexota bacterium]